MTAISDRAPAVAAVSGRSRPRTVSWQQRYVERLAWTDVAVIGVAVAIAQLGRFGRVTETVEGGQLGATIGYTAVSAVLGLGWVAAMAMFRTRDGRVVGDGAEEYRRVAHASLSLFGSVAIVAYLTQVDLARGYLALALPSGLLGLLVSRWLWRRWLVRRRGEGTMVATVLVVGSHRSAAQMSATFERQPGAGYRVVGVCVPGSDHPAGETIKVDGHTVPIVGDELAVGAAIRSTGANTVAVSNTDFLGVDGMRELAWELQAEDVDLVVAPGVVDVAGPRLKIRPVAGLPLLHVEEPQYEGAQRFGKAAVDMSIAVAVLLLASPVLLIAALAVKATSRGPVLYRSERVGLDGTSFAMLKLRTMVADADSRRDGLRGNDGAGPLFKLRRDPRVTPVGRVLRKLSIDELPQLVNVVLRDMSVVGPRPPLRSEVDTYHGTVARRLLVKPGITGLWQVSGRSDLTWEESVRLDLSYVENWSIVSDLVIVARTVRAVLRGTGAY